MADQAVLDTLVYLLDRTSEQVEGEQQPLRAALVELGSTSTSDVARQLTPEEETQAHLDAVAAAGGAVTIGADEAQQFRAWQQEKASRDAADQAAFEEYKAQQAQQPVAP